MSDVTFLTFEKQFSEMLEFYFIKIFKTIGGIVFD